MAFEKITPHGMHPDYIENLRNLVTGDQDFSFTGEQVESEWLPPRDTWLVDPFDKKNKMPTPVNELGLVDARALLLSVISTVDPNFKWGGVLSGHHLYPDENWYKYPMAGVRATEFRDLPVNKVMMPKIMENWLHLMMLQPDIPIQDVQEECINSWVVHKGMFKIVQRAAVWDKRTVRRAQEIAASSERLPEEFEGVDIEGISVLHERSRKKLRGVEIHLNHLHAVPDEFRYVKPEDGIAEPENMGARRRFAKELGKVVVPRAVPHYRYLRAA